MKKQSQHIGSQVRDDFSQKTKDILDKRVSFLCSNPECKRPTICASSDIKKATSIGIAAHITAASKGGPRYNEALNPLERSSIDNGIWLCSNCATLIDKDSNYYTFNLLTSWKEQAELESKKNLEGFKNNKNELNPFLEADLIYSFGVKMSRQLSLKNPNEIVDGSRIFQPINEPIFHWEIVWKYSFTIFNNSIYPAYNVKVKSIGMEHFTKLSALPNINNISPLENVDLKAKQIYFIEDNYKVADTVLNTNGFSMLNNIILNISYYDDNRDLHETLVTFKDGTVNNLKNTVLPQQFKFTT